MISEPKDAFPSRCRIAIVGGGISGISCSWILRHSNFHVDIYESNDRLGGHANSVPFKGKNGISVDVDTGFIAMNEATYPQFNTFLVELGVEIIPTDMSFGVSTSDGSFAWGSSSVWGFIGTFSNFFSPWFWRLIFDIVRFTLFAKDALSEDASTSASATTPLPGQADGSSRTFESIGAWLKQNKYSTQFIAYFIIPMVAAPWCIDTEEFSRTFPAKPLIRFMFQHGLLDTAFRTLRWRSFRNGSKTYVDAFCQQLPPNHHLHLSTSVQRVCRFQSRVEIELADGQSRPYDHVVLAVHANQALTMLGDEATGLERRILGAFKTSRNVCYLHSDEAFLPKRKSARVAWNCLLDSPSPRTCISFTSSSDLKPAASPSNSTLQLTFDMNRLQAIPNPPHPLSPGRVLVTMNPSTPPPSPQSSEVYFHPLISAESISMAREINLINGTRNVSFAGAWMGFGFHEDGFASGAHVGRMIRDGTEGKEFLDLVGNGQKMEMNNMGISKRVLRGCVQVIQWFVQRV